MNNFIYEAVPKKTFDTSGDVWNSLIEAGLANDDGSLRRCDIKTRGHRADYRQGCCRRTWRFKRGRTCRCQSLVRIRRTRVEHPDTAPYKSIVLLLMKFGDEMYRGTGFMIKKNVVLTAAHNIYDQQEKSLLMKSML